MVGTAVRSLRSKNVKSIAVVPRATGDAEQTAATAIQGAFIALFDPDKYRTVDKEQKTIDRLVVVIEDGDRRGRFSVAWKLEELLVSRSTSLAISPTNPART